MVKDGACDVPNRFWPNCWLAAIFGARTNDNQVRIPLGGTFDDFALRSSLALEDFSTRKIAQSLIQYVLCRCFFGLPHLVTPWRERARGSQEAFIGSSFLLRVNALVDNLLVKPLG